MDSYEKPKTSNEDQPHDYDIISKVESNSTKSETTSLTRWKFGMVACFIILGCSQVGLFSYTMMTHSQINSLEALIEDLKNQQSVMNTLLQKQQQQQQQQQQQNRTCSEKDANNVSGPPGPAGRSGDKRSPNEKGNDGLPGEPGDRGSNGPRGGAVYTRWGRTTCGNDSKLIYQGFAGATNHLQTGGGTNYQCLPLDPDSQTKIIDSEAAWITGVEYQTNKFGIFDNSAHNQNAPCARCYNTKRFALMMIPGKKDCEPGWSKEYSGYLMTEQYNHHRSTFECVDANPEYINGEAVDTNGALFYFTKIDCDRGGLCPPYVDKMALQCVVCTK